MDFEHLLYGGEAMNNARQENRNFLYETLEGINSLRAQFSTIFFEQIAPNIYNIEIPPDQEYLVDTILGRFTSAVPPELLGLNSREALAEANILQFHDYPYGELRGNGVLIGFVDTGIDYTHKVFRNEDNTSRIVAIWDQSIPGAPPEGFTYGTEYLQEQINEALRAEDPYSIVPSRDENGHGTFLAGIAAGDDKTVADEYFGGAPNASIAVVKLRPARQYIREYYVIREGAVAYQDNDVIAGISYLGNLAFRLRRPMIICLAIGNNDGAHDGSSILERYLERLSIVSGLVIVSSAGNETNAGHHFAGNITNGATQSFEINVEEGERGFTVMIWAMVPDKISVSIRSPIGQIIERVPLAPSKNETFTFTLQQSEINIRYIYPYFKTGGLSIEIRFLNPVPGLWSITVYGDNIVNGRYNVWLPRVDFAERSTRFLEPVPFTTVCIPSTAQNIIVVGAYSYIDKSVYVASGRGPTADGHIKPDLIAPGLGINAPIPGGGFGTFVGTGAAAAITAAACALLVQWALIEENFPWITTRIVRNILIRGATRQEGVTYPNNIEGYGRLNLFQSLQMI